MPHLPCTGGGLSSIWTGDGSSSIVVVMVCNWVMTNYCLLLGVMTSGLALGVMTCCLALGMMTFCLALGVMTNDDVLSCIRRDDVLSCIRSDD